jgi:hypothetical protein
LIGYSENIHAHRVPGQTSVLLSFEMIGIESPSGDSIFLADLLASATTENEERDIVANDSGCSVFR